MSGHPILRAETILEDYLGAFSSMFPRTSWLYSLDPGKHAQATCVATDARQQVVLKVTLNPPVILVGPHYYDCDNNTQYNLTDPKSYEKVQSRLKRLLGEHNV